MFTDHLAKEPVEDTDPSTISLNTVGYAFYINSDDWSFFSPPLFLGLDSVLVLHMSGVFFLDYVRSLSTCLFKYVFLFILNLSFFLATPCGMWNLSSPTRDGTCVPCNGRRVLNHWTTKEVSACLILILSIFNDPLLQKSKYIA